MYKTSRVEIWLLAYLILSSIYWISGLGPYFEQVLPYSTVCLKPGAWARMNMIFRNEDSKVHTSSARVYCEITKIDNMRFSAHLYTGSLVWRSGHAVTINLRWWLSSAQGFQTSSHCAFSQLTSMQYSQGSVWYNSEQNNYGIVELFYPPLSCFWLVITKLW